MNLIKITPEPNLLYQQQVMNLTVGKKTTRAVFELTCTGPTNGTFHSMKRRPAHRFARIFR